MSCLQKLINVKLSIPLIDNKGMSCVRHAYCEKAHYRRLSKSGMLFVVFTDFGESKPRLCRICRGAVHKNLS